MLRLSLDVPLDATVEEEAEPEVEGECHDQADEGWIVMRGSQGSPRSKLESNPYGQPFPDCPVGRLGSGCLQGDL